MSPDSTEALVDACIASVGETDPRSAVREILQRFVTGRGVAGYRERPDAAGLHLLYRSSTLTVLDVIWPPRMTLFPHDHRMWAAIGIYCGQEDNAFYRREGDSLVSSGGREVPQGSVLLLGEDTIHSVHNPSASFSTGAIHVYGGDFVRAPRSQWDPDTLTEQPYDLEVVQQEFHRAQESFRRS